MLQNFSEHGINLSNLTRFVPSLQYRRKSVTLNMHALKRHGFSHVIVKMPSGSSEVCNKIIRQFPYNKYTLLYEIHFKF